MSIRIALAGNPNSGKTSLFNRITGAMQKVGNWGGVTVDIKEGTATIRDEKVQVVDLPGTYSLSALSEEELVARNYIVQEMPEVVVDVIDATNLDRHLYLAFQLMEMNVRPILALNMWDEVESKGILVDVKRLEALLGLAVVPTSARTGEGVDQLVEKAYLQAHNRDIPANKFVVKFPNEIENCIQRIQEALPSDSGAGNAPRRWVAIKLLEKDPEVEKSIYSKERESEIRRLSESCIRQVEEVLGDDPETLIAESRYGFIAGLVRETVRKKPVDRIQNSDRIDSVLTHRFWAYPVFLGFMWLLFQVTFKLGEYPMGWIEILVEWMQIIAATALPEGALQDLVVNGILAGVGGVVVFLPNILILFFGISIMEDTGYMARAAFIMDRLMHKIGLHGKSFIPMIMGLGCSVPAIMAARTLESRNDRIKTILLTPLVSCSARLPVFVLFAGALFPNNAGNIVFLFQVIFGFGAFVLMALLFKLTLFRGAEEYPFVMELPPYRIPTARSVFIHMWHKGKHYLRKMGGVVLVFSVILWWAGAYPKADGIEARFDREIAAVSTLEGVPEEEKEGRIAQIKVEKTAAIMGQTYIGRVGKFFEPLVKPFGTDWRGAVSLVTGFVAKEVVVGSMGVLYAIGEEEDEESEKLRGKLREHFIPLSAFAFMLFVLLYTPCVVALVTVIRELKSLKWSIFSVVYQLVFAWCAATLVFQIGRLSGLG